MLGSANIVAILLAAGRSSRFHGDKLCAPWGDGECIGVASAITLQAVLPVIAVVSAGNEKLARLFRMGGIPAVVNDANDGVGSTIACGIRHSDTASGWLLMPADKPLVQGTTVESVYHKLRAGASLVVPYHQGRPGHPVAFSRLHREALLALSGDEGVRYLIRRYRENIAAVNTDDEGVVMDIDTWQDYQVAMEKADRII